MLPAGNRRRAVTLVEVLLTVGVFAVLIGLLLPAVQQVRAAAARTQAANKQRHVILAAHLFVDGRGGGRLPGPLSATRVGPDSSSGPRDYNALYDVYPYIEGEPHDLYEFVRDNGGRALMARLRGVFLSPADPTPALLPPEDAKDAYSSFSSNMRAFAGQPPFPAGLPDGTSSTLAYAERYAVLPPTDPDRPRAWIWYRVTENTPTHAMHRGNYYRRATFADDGHADVVPVTTGNPPTTRSSEPGVTFLTKPAYRDDYIHVLQSPYPHGLQVAFFDGSVRFLRAGISEQTFWGMVTRDGGEVVTEE